jgi:hypothetical protein
VEAMSGGRGAVGIRPVVVRYLDIAHPR